jgi:tetratricopeptide (TPR) repeat protein
LIANSSQLLAISQMTKGDLGEIPFPVLLHALSLHDRSVVLSIERRQVKKDVILENGVPTDCQSNLLPDTLGKFMVARGELTEEQNHALLSKSATTGKPLAELLVLEGVVNPHDLYKILQLNLAKKLLDAFTWQSGSFRVSTGLPDVDSPLKVNAPQLVLTGVLKFTPESEIGEAMAPFESKKFFVAKKPPVPLKDLRLSREHQEALRHLTQGKSLVELQSEAAFEKSRALRLLYALAIIGTVIPEDWRSDDEAAAAVLEVPDSDFASEAPQATAGNAAEIGNQVMELYLRFRKLDAFDLLGIKEDATPKQMEQAYIDFSEKFHPSRFAFPELQSMQEKARDLFLAGGRAFGELQNPETRNSLIGRRQSRFRQLSPEEARNAFAIKSNLLDSETQFAKGMALVKQGKYAEALELLQFAHDCEPQKALYRAELAYCRYRKAPEHEAKAAIDALRETVRIDPDCGLAYYYAGLIHADSGEFAEAEPLLQRAIKLMTPDRRPIDALKKLKAAERERPKKRLFF